MSFLNKLTRYLDYKLIVSKAKAYIVYTKYESWEETMSNKRIKTLKTDNGSEYKSFKLELYLLKKDTNH